MSCVWDEEEGGEEEGEEERMEEEFIRILFTSLLIFPHTALYAYINA